MAPSTKAIIMAGGRGERFWPVSTAQRPKQFITLTDGGTLIQQTVLRLAQIIPFRDIYVVTGAAYVDLARQQLPQIPAKNFIVEPMGRDTAACIGLGAVWLEKVDPEAVMLVVPSDHFIPDQERFCDLLQTTVRCAADSGGLFTLGVRPSRPETGFGYIETGERCLPESGESVYKVQRFVEKPDRLTAEEYVASNRFLWNAGVFVWQVGAIRQAIRTWLPELHAGLEELAALPDHAAMVEQLGQVFPRLPKISIDYGVMERAQNVYVVESDFRWDDLGSWTAVARLREPDAHGNVLRGTVLTEDCSNVMVESQGRLVAALGVTDLIVVETEDAVLVCSRDRVQDIRKLAVKVQEAAMVKPVG